MLSRLGLVADVGLLRAVLQPVPGAGDASAVGFADLTLGAKLLVFDDELTLSLYAGWTLPTGVTDKRQPLGQGDHRVELAVVVGKLFEKVPLFADGRVGFVLRGEADVTDPRTPTQPLHVAYAPEVRYAAEVGYALLTRRSWLRKLTFAAKLEGGYGAGARADDGLGVLTPPSKSYLKLGPAAAWRFAEHVELSLSGGAFVVGAATPRLVEAALALAVVY